ncbi:hypothetical protein OENI_60033 [Oenococcus oeni]|nr:hypothetical protein OENI_60033 [Oenococcus oeni]
MEKNLSIICRTRQKDIKLLAIPSLGYFVGAKILPLGRKRIFFLIYK